MRRRFSFFAGFWSPLAFGLLKGPIYAHLSLDYLTSSPQAYSGPLQWLGIRGEPPSGSGTQAEWALSWNQAPALRQSGFVLQTGFFLSKAQFFKCPKLNLPLPRIQEIIPWSKPTPLRWLGIELGYQSGQNRLGFIFDTPLNRAEADQTSLWTLETLPEKQRIGLRGHSSNRGFHIDFQYQTLRSKCFKETPKPPVQGTDAEELNPEGFSLDQQLDCELSYQLNFLARQLKNFRVIIGYNWDCFDAEQGEAKTLGIFRQFWGIAFNAKSMMKFAFGQEILQACWTSNDKLAFLGWPIKQLKAKPIICFECKLDLLQCFGLSPPQNNPWSRSRIRTYLPTLLDPRMQCRTSHPLLQKNL